MRNPFRYFNSYPEVIRLAVMMYIRYPLSLPQVEDLRFERGIDICQETVRYWCNELLSNVGDAGFRSKLRVYKSGIPTDGGCFTRGHLYRLLSNPIYVGKVIHKGECYEGAHDAIIDEETWDAVQTQLKRNAANRRAATNAKSPSLLSGLLREENGERLIPSHASTAGKRYRYHVSAPDDDGFAQVGWRLPAKEIERTVINGVIYLLRDPLRPVKELELTDVTPDQIESLIHEAEKLGTGFLEAGIVAQRDIFLKIVSKIEVRLDGIRIQIDTDGLSQQLGHRRQGETSAGRVEIDIPVRLKRRGVEKKIVITDRNQRPAVPDANLIKAVAQGRLWFEQLKSGGFGTIREISRNHNTDGENVTRTMRLAFLAPDIVKTILEGRQPPELTAFHLKRVRNLPLSWDEQRKMLGFSG